MTTSSITAVTLGTLSSISRGKSRQSRSAIGPTSVDQFEDWYNQVWAMDITYIPMERGFVYLAVVLDWATRRVLSWRLSITMEAAFCVETLEDALARHGKPEISARSEASSRQHGSRFAVHRLGLHRPARQQRNRHQHGRQGRMARQRVRRAAVAQRQIRGGISAGLPQRQRGSLFDWP